MYCISEEVGWWPSFRKNRSSVPFEGSRLTLHYINVLYRRNSRDVASQILAIKKCLKAGGTNPKIKSGWYG
jgi:hypothetical protein